MGSKSGILRTLLAGTTALTGIVGVATSAGAGGFEVREQSALFQGMAFAGAAAGGTSLSSMFWNPAAAAYVGDGITMDSNYSLILPDSDITVRGIDPDGPGAAAPIPAAAFPFDPSVDIGRDAIVPASYYAYRFSPDLVFAMSINSQFGLGTEPDNPNWLGAPFARTAKLFSVNATPTIAYQIAPGVQVGAGLQVQYLDLKRFKSATGFPPAPSATLEGDDVSAGFTLGANFNPAPGTSIGIGYRSSIEHDLEGSFKVPGLNNPIAATVELPEKVTASITQSISSVMRVSGTVEWTNWSRLDVIPVNSAGGAIPAGVTVANLDFQWQDGWYFALGGEYDYSATTTFRAGVAYEISPIDDPSQRLVQLPDADRVWASIGGSYKWSAATTVNFAYSHVFVEDSSLARMSAGALPPNPATLLADVDSSVDILSVGLSTKW